MRGQFDFNCLIPADLAALTAANHNGRAVGFNIPAEIMNRRDFPANTETALDNVITACQNQGLHGIYDTVARVDSAGRVVVWAGSWYSPAEVREVAAGIRAAFINGQYK